MQLNEFSLLTDENIDPVVLDYLRKTGFDVLDVKEQGGSGRKDDKLLTIATTQNRVVVTHNSDFGTLVFRMNSPFVGIIYLRPGHFDATPHVQSLSTVLAQHFEVEPPFIIIAENAVQKIRIRLRQL